VDGALRLFGIASVAAMGTILVAATWIAWRQPAAVSAMLTRLPAKRVGHLMDRVQAFETQTYGSARLPASRMIRLVATETTFHFLSFAECWFTLTLLTGVSSPLAALVLDSVNRLVNVVFKMIVMRAGVDEAGANMVADAIAVSPERAVILALVRKARLIVWAAVGFGIWAAKTRTDRLEARGSRLGA